ncbi:hypothetical protein Tco_0108917 [Tanacetum coccineum]
MFMHTARDESILGPMRFVSNSDDFQVYGALLPNRMTNQQMLDSNACKTYLAYATGATSPKMKRKFKKSASPLKNLSSKKAPAKGNEARELIETDAAILEEAQLKKALKRSKRETNIHQVGGLSKGADSELKVLNELKGKSIDTKSRNNDDEEETKDEFVHTPPNYVPTDDETNDESNDVTEEEYERINEELYSDINVRLTYAEPTNEEKGDEEITDTGHVNADRVNVIQEGACNQVKDDAQATQKTGVPLHSSSISSD